MSSSCHCCLIDILSMAPPCFCRIRSSVYLHTLNITQDSHGFPPGSPCILVSNLKRLPPGLINVLAAWQVLQKDGSSNRTHQSNRQPDNTQVQTDGLARGCQAEYSYKFNEHPDSRELVASARSSVCTEKLTGWLG